MDKRVDVRIPGASLRAYVGDAYYDLADVAIGGARILGLSRPVGDQFALELVDGDSRVATTGTVRAAGPDGVSVSFGEPTYALMTCIARHGG